MSQQGGVRYIVVADYGSPHLFRSGTEPVVVDAVSTCPWRAGCRWVHFRGASFTTSSEPGVLLNPHVEEVAWNDPILLGPFTRSRPHGVQHYPNLAAASRNLARLVLLIAKETGLRSSATEQPLRKRQVEGLSPSGGSKWIRRQQLQIEHKQAWAEKVAAGFRETEATKPTSGATDNNDGDDDGA